MWSFGSTARSNRAICPRTETGGCVSLLRESKDDDGALRRRTFEFRYRDDELLVVVDGDGDFVYRRPPKDLKPLRATFEDFLVEAIPLAAEQVAAGQQLSALCGCVRHLDLAAAACLRSADRGVRQMGHSDLDSAWFPRGRGLLVVDDVLEAAMDDVVKNAIEELNAYFAQTEDEGTYRKLTREVAKRLNEATWPGAVGRTPDFIVVAIDADSDEGRRSDFRAVLGKDGVARLVKRGLV